MKKYLLAALVLFFLLVTQSVGGLSMVGVPSLELCFEPGRVDESSWSLEECIRYSHPYREASCDLIPAELEELRQYCFLHGLYCERISSLESREQCFLEARKCDEISSAELRASCEELLVSEQTARAVEDIAIIIHFMIPLAILGLIAKMAYDFFKKKLSKKKVLAIVALILLLVLLWFSIIILFCFPPYCVIYY